MANWPNSGTPLHDLPEILGMVVENLPQGEVPMWSQVGGQHSHGAPAPGSPSKEKGTQTKTQGSTKTKDQVITNQTRKGTRKKPTTKASTSKAMNAK